MEAFDKEATQKAIEMGFTGEIAQYFKYSYLMTSVWLNMIAGIDIKTKTND